MFHQFYCLFLYSIHLFQNIVLFFCLYDFSNPLERFENRTLSSKEFNFPSNFISSTSNCLSSFICFFFIKIRFGAAHHGHTQSLGKSSHFVFGYTIIRTTKFSSYTNPHTEQIYLFKFIPP